MRLFKLLTLLSLLITFSFGQSYWIAQNPDSKVTSTEAQAIAELADAIDGISTAEADVLYAVAGGGALTLGSLIVDNLTFDANAMTSTAGDITITPLATNDIVLDGHWEVDGPLITGITDNNTTITAYAGKNITVDGTTFDGGGVAGVSTVTTTGQISAGAGVDLGTSQSLTGTTAMTIGAGSQTVAISSSDWTVDATGNMANIGTIGLDGTITQARTTTANGYTSDISTEWTAGAAMAAGGSNGIYAICNPIVDVQNAYGLRARMDLRDAAADVDVNQLHAIDALINLNDTATIDYTVDDNVSVVGMAIHGGVTNALMDGTGTGSLGGATLNLLFGMWGPTAEQDYALETNFAKFISHAGTTVDYGLNIESSSDMDAGILLNSHSSNSPATMDVGVEMITAADKMVYGVDMSQAGITTADVRLSDSSLMFGDVTNGAILATATGVTNVNYVGALNRTVITLTNYVMTMTDAAAAGSHGTLKLIDFPDGMIRATSVVGDLEVTAISGGVATTAVFDVALGSATTLTNAETLGNANVDFVAKVDGDLIGSVDTIDLLNYTSQDEDGHTSSTDVWLCVAIENASSSASGTMTWSGTIVITWHNMGDY